ncbi:tRNA lysidine(34) synthetase TilS [Desulfotomaculum copahuensis]|uniref:tRNA(Ile)-lysidine synthase n=1 Tax=Desulfotomaculum copahuensis TaxID=1838280 RepID=A0A1B7LCP8_9FIRM|nr:tRNA lysidine(34) synthetase TilS [Desulfotomaculum copahuensis]OAT80686.1 tRNA lysidine(34) synthetase TilS [Desulfotomaculum copahuensis]
MDLMRKVCALIDAFQMIKPGDLVLAGVSGGMDSVSLLHILWSLREERRFSLQAVHFNHLIRGAEARADAGLVRELAGALGLSVIAGECDVPAYRSARGLSLEEAAREARYAFFEQACRRAGANRLALGHHADDQAETILLNLLRGAGPAGLKGIPPVRGPYIRPLLHVRRREIAEYCRRHRLPFREDASNRQDTYTRNRIRLHLIPLLESEYNPRLVDALVRLGEICREEDAYLEEQAAGLYPAARRESDAGGAALELDIDALRAVPPPLRRRMLRRAWRELTGSSADLSYGHVQSLLGMLDNTAGGRAAVLPGGAEAVRAGSRLCFYCGGGRPVMVPPYFYPLAVPGCTYIPEINKTIRAELSPPGQSPDPCRLTAGEALLDRGKLPGPLFVRRRRAGDRFMPLGLGEPVRLKKFLNGCGIAAGQRDCLPLVVCGDDIVWVGGVRPGEKFKVTPLTKEFLYLRIMEGGAPVQSFSFI